MVKENKFKAYHKDFGIVDVNRLELGLKCIRLDNGDLYGFDEIKLMQYTGLKDKNDKEIYEGYILETWNKSYPEHNKDFEGDLVVVKPSLYGEYLLHYLLDWCGISNNVESASRGISNYKIVGNIYENSELVKTRKAR